MISFKSVVADAKKEFLCLMLPDLGILIVDLRLYAQFTFLNI